MRKLLVDLAEPDARLALIDVLAERYGSATEPRVALDSDLDGFLPRPPAPEPEPETPPEDPATQRERVLSFVANTLGLSNKELAVALFSDDGPPACRRASVIRKKYPAE
jgi:hypothetical protein